MNARALVCARCQRAVVLWGIVIAFVLLAGPAWAATVTVDEYTINTVYFTLTGSSKTSSGAGEFKIFVTDPAYGLNSFETVAYCVQLDENIGEGDYTMDLEPLNFSKTADAQVAWLMKTYAPRYYGGTPPDPDSKAGSGLQLAIWDVVYGDAFTVRDSTNPDSDGKYTNQDIKDFYDDYMGDLAAAWADEENRFPDLTNNIKFVRATGTQDLVVYNINNVPVPASLLLLGSGLLALVGLGRRRAKTS